MLGTSAWRRAVRSLGRARNRSRIDFGDVSRPTQAARKSNLCQFPGVTGFRHSPRHSGVRTHDPWVGFGCGRDGANARTGERADRGLGTLAATHPRGLTSNRHAGRPGRYAVRAFAFRAVLADRHAVRPFVFLAQIRQRGCRAAAGSALDGRPWTGGHHAR